MTTFFEDEASVEASRPREGFELILPSITYRLASGDQDLTINGFKYTASTVGRGEVGVSTTSGEDEVAVAIPIDHPVAQRYLANGVPPQTILVNVWRKQLRSGLVERVWFGFVTSLVPDGHVAKLTVASRTGQAAPRRLPTVTAGRACPHVLYDSMCQVDPDDFKVTTTVAAIDTTQRFITLTSDGGSPDDFLERGFLLHVPSGEKMTLHSHVGNVVELQLPIFGMHVGDAVDVFAGCDLLIGTCLAKFENQVNFGGQPDLPKENPFLPNGFGVLSQE